MQVTPGANISITLYVFFCVPSFPYAIDDANSRNMIAAPSLSLNHYRALLVKQIQNDTLSHFVLARASTFSLAASGDLTLTQECVEASQIYVSNSQEVRAS